MLLADLLGNKIEELEGKGNEDSNVKSEMDLNLADENEEEIIQMNINMEVGNDSKNQTMELEQNILDLMEPSPQKSNFFNISGIDNAIDQIDQIDNPHSKEKITPVNLSPNQPVAEAHEKNEFQKEDKGEFNMRIDGKGFKELRKYVNEELNQAIIMKSEKNSQKSEDEDPHQMNFCLEFDDNFNSPDKNPHSKIENDIMEENSQDKNNDEFEFSDEVEIDLNKDNEKSQKDKQNSDDEFDIEING